MAELAVSRRAWMLVLAVGVALFVADQRALVSTNDPNLVPSVILLGSVVAPAAFLAFVYGRRLGYDVPVGVVLATAVLGGVIGTVIATLVEYHTLRRLGLFPLLAVGVTEEAAKLIVPAGALLLLRYRRPSDGLLLGVAAGAGFAALETMGYAFVDLTHSHGSVTAVENLLLLRGVTSPAGHMAWTGITAAALWEAAARGWELRAIRHLVAAFLLAAALHALWDGSATLTGFGVVAAVSLAALGWVTHRAAVLTSGESAGRLFSASRGQHLRRTA